MAASPMPKSGLASNDPVMHFTTILLMIRPSLTRRGDPSNCGNLLRGAPSMIW